MENQAQPQPAYITTLALLNRQLTDWQNLRADFEASQAPADQLAYCERQIERLKTELLALSN